LLVKFRAKHHELPPNCHPSAVSCNLLASSSWPCLPSRPPRAVGFRLHDCTGRAWWPPKNVRPVRSRPSVDALAQQVCEVRVPKAVECDWSDASLAHDITELAAELVRWPGASFHICEDCLRLAETQGHALFGLTTPVFMQHLHSYGGHRA